MKVLMDVSGIRELEDYINSDTIPMVVCPNPNVEISDEQRVFLEKHYDKIIDKRGWVSYYCNVINAGKCRDMKYESIMQPNGKEEVIKDFGLQRSHALRGKYVVVVRYQSGKTIDGVSLIKSVRLKTETKKKQMNSAKKTSENIENKNR